ncbi:MAG: Lacal_2735 family protein [Gammaproteobacteria bacterium]|nr:Lacal_2735 family protein [Gammaproteobacteria bacterium]MBU2182882.1 Lacal_2735 family protein [Gammaproteobacteria bacterium]MBU2203472.1 Lacal_2735 family protein [Gammaproteobacteria bacterium]
MFGWLKSDPVKKLRKAYDQKLEQAMHAQRNGDMRLYADLTAESEEIWQTIQQLEKTAVKS